MGAEPSANVGRSRTAVDCNRIGEQKAKMLEFFHVWTLPPQPCLQTRRTLRHRARGRLGFPLQHCPNAEHPGHPAASRGTQTLWLPNGWGLIPFWAKDASIGYKMISARAETVATKPAFREALKKRRCLIPADGFYEWKKNGKTKTPFCFTMA